MSAGATEADETAAQAEALRHHHYDRETALIAQAEASIAAGRLVDEADVDAWIDSIGTGHELPVPRLRR